ncbi:hypothetical protein AC578_7050 [Pseudocercospora eumusae]|uniref:DUF1593 domain-containing protein n=1 Tax=Pseudocercospora eumusae TaxID=321146 RepID=A0A139GWL4_9PEZI|nr:hypothetical protein AC578_7050 [Pseudocercospora eumusae]
MVQQESLRCCNTKPRVFVLTDISNEPDDAESLVRYLLYNNELETEGLVACTSTWMRTKVDPVAIIQIVQAYGEVVDSLNCHVHPKNQYPSADHLSSLVRTGPAMYGKEALEDNVPLSGGAELLVERLADDADDRPLWVLCWGGTNCLAQALQHIHRTNNAEVAAAMRSKLRIYAISDQDDTGYWIRLKWPDIFYICSVHGWNDYAHAAWTGMSAQVDGGGPDPTKMTKEWLKEHIQIGPFGKVYPDFKFIVEGDTPTFLYLIQNGLGSPEHPSFGSWGGRYNAIDLSLAGNHYSDATDTVLGKDGRWHTSSQATIWRWRDAYQNDFAARMQWTLTNDRMKANHAPIASIDGSTGPDPLYMRVPAGSQVILDASLSRDPHERALQFRWFVYKEAPSASGLVAAQVPNIHVEPCDWTNVGKMVKVQMPPPEKCAIDLLSGVPQELGQCFHLILEVKNEGLPPLVSYKRVILQATNEHLRGGRDKAVDSVTEWLELGS